MKKKQTCPDILKKKRSEREERQSALCHDLKIANKNVDLDILS